MNRKFKGDAYQVTETHEGLPKSYISEKLCSAIVSQYRLITNLQKHIPDDLNSPLLKNAPPSANLKDDFFLGEAIPAFRFMITSFLALHNRLGLWDESLVDSLLEQSEENLESWLTRVEFVKEK